MSNPPPTPVTRTRWAGSRRENRGLVCSEALEIILRFSAIGSGVLHQSVTRARVRTVRWRGAGQVDSLHRGGPSRL